VGEALTSAHFDRLVLLNERHGNRYFEVGHRRIRLRSYVGVIQVGSLTIEILPKADKGPASEQQKAKWQRALVGMLKQSGVMRLASISDAALRLRSCSLLDIFIESFLCEVEDLVHHGLVRKYRPVCGNVTALKGRILFSQHLARNVIHRERFFTEHVVYEHNNVFNQILHAALAVLARVAASAHLVARSRALALSFDGVDETGVDESTFARLLYSRNTERYRRAIQLARLILLNFSPDVRYGGEDVLAILFDMNLLFERYVYVQLKRAETDDPARRITFKAQSPRRFWETASTRRSIRPDIVCQVAMGDHSERVILDTKWKLPDDGKPSDSDLHQMHTYNIQFGARRSFLLYPRVSTECDIHGSFSQSEPPGPVLHHSCGMLFLDLFEGDKLRSDLGSYLLKRMTEASPRSAQALGPQRECVSA
jgi:5-methylcytosine-specific restriction enzyme subunit McrC